MADKSRHYYEARGFSIYYFANAVFNVVKDADAYLRGIEEILGDMQVLNLMMPSQKFTNLHYFLEAIIRDIIQLITKKSQIKEHKKNIIESEKRIYKMMENLVTQYQRLMKYTKVEGQW